MKRLNSAFLFLVLMIGLLSIAYIWKSEAEKQSLEIKISTQTQEISSLKNQVANLETTFGSLNNQNNVLGATTTSSEIPNNEANNIAATTTAANTIITSDAEQGSTGTITGTVQLSTSEQAKTTIVCAENKFTNKEICTSELTQTDSSKKLQYILEVPRGKYSVFANSPPNSKKAYYSKVQKCDNNGNCESNNEILLKIVEDETQSDINLYF